MGDMLKLNSFLQPDIAVMNLIMFTLCSAWHSLATFPVTACGRASFPVTAWGRASFPVTAWGQASFPVMAWGRASFPVTAWDEPHSQ